MFICWPKLWYLTLRNYTLIGQVNNISGEYDLKLNTKKTKLWLLIKTLTKALQLESNSDF